MGSYDQYFERADLKTRFWTAGAAISILMLYPDFKKLSHPDKSTTLLQS